MSTFSRFPVPELDTLPDDIRARIVAVQEKAGFIPNVFLAWAHRPDEFRAFFAYNDALMEKAGGLTKAEREMIVVATSAVNHCHYCVISHGAILRIRAKDPRLADQIAINYLNADLTERHRAMLDFAVKVAARSHEVNERRLRRAPRGTASPTTRSGTSARSPRCSRSRTGWPTCWRCARTTSSTRWDAKPAARTARRVRSRTAA